jgi:hypothetical protein
MEHTESDMIEIIYLNNNLSLALVVGGYQVKLTAGRYWRRIVDKGWGSRY